MSNSVKEKTNELYIKNTLIKAYEDITPNRLDELINKPIVKVKSMEEVLGSSHRKSVNNNWWIPISGTAVAAMLALTIGMNYNEAQKNRYDQVAAYVYIDVNPSIEIEVASNGTVLGCRAYNEDAKEILDNDVVRNSVSKHEKLDVVMKKVMISIRNNGYFSGQYGSVLFSEANVSGENEYITQTFEEVTEYVMSHNLCQNVVSTEVENLSKAMEQAQQYGVSPGKITYITEVAEDASYVDELVTKNIDTIVNYQYDHSLISLQETVEVTAAQAEEITIDYGANHEMQSKKEENFENQIREEVAGYEN